MAANLADHVLPESVDLLQPETDGTFRLVGIFGDQLIVESRIKHMNLVDHRIMFEE